MSAQPRPTAAARPPQALRSRHVPQRTCIACRTVQAKRGLVRIVRTPQGQVQVDPTGRAPGRGAYLHRDVGCLTEGLRKGRLAKTLHATLSAEDQAALERSLQEMIAAEGQETAQRET